jgi:hypothetical protein
MVSCARVPTWRAALERINTYLPGSATCASRGGRSLPAYRKEGRCPGSRPRRSQSLPSARGRRARATKPTHRDPSDIETRQDTRQIADTIAVRVLKGAGVNLIDDARLPPAICAHGGFEARRAPRGRQPGTGRSKRATRLMRARRRCRNPRPLAVIASVFRRSPRAQLPRHSLRRSRPGTRRPVQLLRVVRVVPTGCRRRTSPLSRQASSME